MIVFALVVPSISRFFIYVISVYLMADPRGFVLRCIITGLFLNAGTV